jgi:hypothetical protein
MSSFRLAFPTDIPWRRRCATREMIDTVPCGEPTPPRWRPSLAIYDYQPPDDFQELPGHVVSFVKVTTTLTGWAPEGDGNFKPESRIWVKRYDVRDPFIAPTYYACYGAILSVAVYPLDDRAGEYQKVRNWVRNQFATSAPADDARFAEVVQSLAVGGEASGDRWIKRLAAEVEWVDADPREVAEVEDILSVIWEKFPAHEWSVSDYPYVADIEPKRRDVYEVVQETGEVVSRTLRGTQVGKSSTHVESEEVLDVFGGGTAGFKGAQVGVQGQWGTRSMTSDQTQNQRNSDVSQELRESASHTTQLTQLYQLLSTYHIGTNRVVSFVLPRPHIRQVGQERQDDISTFVDGPRELEGVQDYMLVVVRPRNMPGIRIEARLDTAHVDNVPITEHLPAGTHVYGFEVQGRTEEASNTTSDASVLKSAVGVALGAAGFVVPALWLAGLASGVFSSRTTTRYITWNVVTFNPPAGTLFDTDAGWTWSNIAANKNVVEKSVVEFTETKLVAFVAVWSETYKDYTLGIDWLNKDPEPNIGRYESEVVVHLKEQAASIVGYEKTTFTVSHGLCCPDMGRYQMPGVIHETPPKVDRYATAKGYRVPLQFANEEQRAIAGYLADPRRGGLTYSSPVEVIDTGFFGRASANALNVRRTVPIADVVGDDFYKRLPTAVRRMTYAEALQVPIATIDSLSGVPGTGAQLRRMLLGTDAESVARRTEPEVPDLRGRGIDEADALARDAGLQLTPVWVDAVEGRGTVLDQDPVPGKKIPAGLTIEARVSRGFLTVPDLTGLTTASALAIVRRAGFTTDTVVKGEGRIVTAQNPPPGSAVPLDMTIFVRTDDPAAEVGE